MKELKNKGQSRWESLPDRYSLEYAVVSKDLSDHTMVGCNDWSKIKIEAMSSNYKY